VAGHEPEVLDTFGIPWRTSSPSDHIRCPYPDHEDKDPSWRWDKEKRRAYCTCSPQGDNIAGVVMKIWGLDYSQAKFRIVKHILRREDLIRTTGERGAERLLDPPPDQRDDGPPRAYLAHRLGIAPKDVLMPTSPAAGWRKRGYYDGSLDRHVGYFPCAVFGLVNSEGRIHVQRIYVKPGARARPRSRRSEDGTPRSPKKAAKLAEGDSIDGRRVHWGDPATAPTTIVGEGIESAQAGAQANAAQINAGTIAAFATVSASWMPQWQPGPKTETVIILADRDEAKDPKDTGFKAGQKAAEALAAKLMAMGLRVFLALPGSRGTNCDALNVWEMGGASAVRALIDTAKLWSPASPPPPPPLPPKPVAGFAEFTDFLSGDTVVPIFPTHLLPHPFNAHVADIADRMQVPPDFAAIPLLIQGATMLGRKFRLLPKRHDVKWQERACLWGMVIALSGSRKTPAQADVLAPIHRMQAEGATTRTQWPNGRS
jgi:hypothetical protein